MALAARHLPHHQAQEIYHPRSDTRRVLVDALSRHLAQLGLQRRVKVKSLTEILTKDNDQQANGNGSADEAPAQQ